MALEPKRKIVTKSNHKSMNITFLLGAGASIPAGYSSTICLTKKVLQSGENRSDINYPDSDPIPLYDVKPLIPIIIKWLHEKSREYFHSYRGENNVDINYEHLYYLASQFRDDYTELQNPALLSMINQFKSDMSERTEFKAFYRKYSYYIDGQCRSVFDQIFANTCMFIEAIIQDVLGDKEEPPIDHLEIIRKVHYHDKLNLNGIATLAHDTHVETYLKQSGIKIADGFDHPVKGDPARIWRNQFSDEGYTPFLKLHGSVNWQKYTLKNPDNDNTLPSIETASHENIDLDKSVYFFKKDFNLPTELLIGTFNKPARYSWGLMLDIHYRFRKILANTQTLIVCGYSFGDKAINTQLIFWYRAQRNRSIIVIDPRAREQIIQSARFAAGEVLQRNGVAHFIDQPMEDVSFDKLIQLLR